MSMKYMMVLQWSASEIQGLVALGTVENIIKTGLLPLGEINGEGAGGGVLNIFIGTNQPQQAYEKVKENLWMYKCWESIRVAYREMSGSDFTVIWPKGLSEFKV